LREDGHIMADLSRVLQKIFGTSGGSTEFGQIGSDAAGSPTTTKDLTTIQALSQFEGGLFDITADAAEPPRIEDLNALYFLITSQLSYLFQKGIPEWIATENYYGTKSIVQVAGAIYRSVTDSLNQNPTTDDGTYWELISDSAMTMQTKVAIEKSHYLLETFSLPDLRDPSAWDADNPDDYFPAKCLTSIDTYEDISSTVFPDAVAALRAIKTIFKDGLTGEITDPVVTGWAIASNVATLTFQNDADHIAFLAALLEDEVQHGSYTNWRTVTLASAIGSISAGVYAITNVNSSTRTITFSFTGSDGSGSVTSSATFYAYRTTSSTTARLFSAKGLSLMGVNDANGYFVAGGLRRRGYFQGHGTKIRYDGNAGSDSSMLGSSGLGTSLDGSTTGAASVIESDTVNGDPRFAKETHSPAISVHLYMHMGSYIS